jgi:hypothetical protein
MSGLSWGWTCGGVQGEKPTSLALHAPFEECGEEVEEIVRVDAPVGVQISGARRRERSTERWDTQLAERCASSCWAGV